MTHEVYAGPVRTATAQLSAKQSQELGGNLQLEKSSLCIDERADQKSREGWKKIRGFKVSFGVST